MSEIIPAVLAANASDLEDKLGEIPSEVKLVHLDVLEGDVWVDTNASFEVHLMVLRPEEIMERWIERGAERIITHKFSGEISKFKDRTEIGLGVELHIPLEEIYPLVSEVDFIHLMSIAKIGEQGHPLDRRIFDRIKRFKAMYPEVPISVDGGVNISNYEALNDLNVERLVVGSGFDELWKSLTKN